MMSPDEQTNESAAVKMITTILNETHSDLDKAGLRAELLPIRRSSQPPHSSELAVWFWTKEGAAVADVLEFFIIENNVTSELGKLETWFRDSLRDVIDKRAS